MFLCTIVNVLHQHNCRLKTTNLFLRESHFNSIELPRMTTPYTTLTVSKATQDQQAKQDCIYLWDDLGATKKTKSKTHRIELVLTTYSWRYVQMKDSTSWFLYMFFKVVHDNIRGDSGTMKGNCDMSFPGTPHIPLQLFYHTLDEKGLSHPWSLWCHQPYTGAAATPDNWNNVASSNMRLTIRDQHLKP